MSYETRPDAAVSKAAEILGRRAMSRGELVEKLLNYGFSEDEASRAADRMEELSAVDDFEYARTCAGYYIARGMGKRRIREELRRRKIPPEIIDGVLDDLPGPDGSIEEYIRRKLKDPSDKAEKRRVVNALLRRGFDYEVINRVIRRFISEDYY